MISCVDINNRIPITAAVVVTQSLSMFDWMRFVCVTWITWCQITTVGTQDIHERSVDDSKLRKDYVNRFFLNLKKNFVSSHNKIKRISSFGRRAPNYHECPYISSEEHSTPLNPRNIKNLKDNLLLNETSQINNLPYHYWEKLDFMFVQIFRHVSRYHNILVLTNARMYCIGCFRHIQAYLSQMPVDGFLLWHLTWAGGACAGPLGPAAASTAASAHAASAYRPVMAYIDSCLLIDTKKDQLD